MVEDPCSGHSPASAPPLFLWALEDTESARGQWPDLHGEPHHTPSGPAQATYTGPTSCHGEAREGRGHWEAPTRARGLRDTPHSAGPRAGGPALPRLGAPGPPTAGRLCPTAASQHPHVVTIDRLPGLRTAPRRTLLRPVAKGPTKFSWRGVGGHDPGPGAEPGASLGSPEPPAAPAREPGADGAAPRPAGRVGGCGPTAVASWGLRLRTFLCPESGPSWDPEGEGPRLQCVLSE